MLLLLLQVQGDHITILLEGITECHILSPQLADLLQVLFVTSSCKELQACCHREYASHMNKLVKAVRVQVINMLEIEGL